MTRTDTLAGDWPSTDRRPLTADQVTRLGWLAAASNGTEPKVTGWHKSVTGAQGPIIRMPDGRVRYVTPRGKLCEPKPPNKARRRP